jgi:hypothetical protein
VSDDTKAVLTAIVIYVIAMAIWISPLGRTVEDLWRVLL